MIVGRNALFDQVMSESVGLRVQLTVGHRALAMLGGHTIRMPGGTLFEQTVHRLFAWVITAGIVEHAEQFLTLGSRQNGQLRHVRVRLLLKRQNHVRQRFVQVIADPLRFDARRGLRRETETFAQVIDAQGQWIVAAFLGVQHLDTLPGLHSRVVSGFVCRAVTVVEQGIEQRSARGQCAAALGQRQLRMLVGQQTGQPAVSVEHSIAHRLAAQFDAQRQGVDEHTQRPFHTFGAVQAAQQYRAEDHALASRQVPEHLGPGQVHQTGGADTQQTRLIAHLMAQGVVQHQTCLVGNVFLRGEGEAIRQRRLIDVAQLFAEERFVGGIVRALQHLSDVVAVRNRLGQLRVVAQQDALQLLAQYIECHMVHDHVMETQRRSDQPGGRIMSVYQMQQRCLGQVHARRVVQILQFNRIHTQSRLAPHDLHRGLQAFPEQRRAQDVVTLDHLL